MKRSSSDPGYTSVPKFDPAADTNPQDWRCITLQIPNSTEYLLQLKSALDGLRSWGNYHRTGDTAGVNTASVWRYALDAVDWSDDQCFPQQPEEGEGCQEINAFHPAISYNPNHPVLQPNFAGDYDAEVWSTGAGYPFATGDDAMINPLGWVSLSIAEAFTIGLPSFTVNFSGAGEVDLHFIGQVQGGAFWVFPDGNWLVGDLVNTQAQDITDLLSVETFLGLIELALQGDYQSFEVVHTMTFETEGDHTITAWHIPHGEAEPPFVGLGGGLRKIQFCGDITLLEDEVLAHTLAIEQDGTLKLLADGVPVSTVDLRSLLDDDYVNVEGDTMTGTLAHKSAADPHVEYYATDALTRLARISRTTADITIYRDPGKVFQIAGSGAVPFITYADAYILHRARPGLGAGLAGNFRYAGDGVSALTVDNLSGSGDITRWSNSALLRALITWDGQLKSKSLQGWDYTSTNAWRQTFALLGGWFDDTDATRKGKAELAIYDQAQGHSIMRASWHPLDDVPTLSFFDAAGHFPDPVTVPSSWENRFAAVEEALTRYGLIDFTLQEMPTELPSAMTEAQLCSAVYWMVSQMADVVSDASGDITIDPTLQQILDKLLTVPIVGGMYSTVTFISVILSLFSNWDQAETDWLNFTDLVDLILLHNLEKQSILDDLSTLGWSQPGQDVAREWIIRLWDDPVVFNWALEYGSHQPNSYCGPFTLPCTDTLYDFRWGTLNGVELTQGTQTWAVGIVNEFTDPWYGHELNFYFDACTLDQVVLTFDVNNINQLCHRHLYTGEPGNWTQVATGADAYGGTGVQVVTWDNLSQHGAIDRLRVRMENEIAPNPDNRTISIRIIPA